VNRSIRSGLSSSIRSIVSSDRHRVANGIGRDSPKAVFAPILQDEGNGVCQTGPAFVARAALTISAGDFRTVANILFAIVLIDSRKFILHGSGSRMSN
jgi:hypothetical protein